MHIFWNSCALNEVSRRFNMSREIRPDPGDANRRSARLTHGYFALSDSQLPLKKRFFPIIKTKSYNLKTIIGGGYGRIFWVLLQFCCSRISWDNEAFIRRFIA
jgi:hypothetical protein